MTVGHLSYTPISTTLTDTTSSVRHRQIQAEQGEDGADQSFGLAQGQAEHGTQRQRRGDGQG